jgi:hypothetical protein
VENRKTPCGKGEEKREDFHKEKRAVCFSKGFQEFSKETKEKLLGENPLLSLKK